MTQVFKNNAFASLAAELSAAGTLATLATGQGARFPAPSGGDHFLATLILLDGNGAETAWEVVKCTSRATDGLTIERAQEGTTARIWPVGSRLEMRVTAGTLDSFTDTTQAAAAAPVQSVFGRTGAVMLQSTDVTGALGFTPLDAAQKNAANGIAPLGADSKVPAAYLPSYVDDVLEYANTAGFPAIGETAKIYVALDTNKTYRWSGSAYVEISPSPGTTDSLTEGATNLYFTTARARAALSATGAVSYNAATGVISAELTSGYASKTISANTTLNADTEYETGRNLRVNHGVKLTVPSTTLLIVRKYAAGSSL
jgi:hypothetical protein